MLEQSSEMGIILSLSLSHPVDGMITAGIMGGAALLGAAAIALVGMGIAKALK